MADSLLQFISCSILEVSDIIHRSLLHYNPMPPSGFFGPQGQTAIMYINVNEESEDMTFSFSQSPQLKTNAAYSVRDLWAHKERGVFKGSFTEKDVEPHDVRAYLFTEVTH